MAIYRTRRDTAVFFVRFLFLSLEASILPLLSQSILSYTARISSSSDSSTQSSLSTSRLKEKHPREPRTTALAVERQSVGRGLFHTPDPNLDDANNGLVAFKVSTRWIPLCTTSCAIECGV